MKNIIQVFAVIVLMAMIGSVGPACAQTPTELTKDEVMMIQKKREMKEQFKDRMKEELGLSDEQQQKIEEQRNSHFELATQNYEIIKNLKDQLQAELEKPELDEPKIRSIHDQLKALKNKMADLRLEGILEVRKILTAEQFKMFHELRGRHKGKWGGEHKESGREFGMKHGGPMSEN